MAKTLVHRSPETKIYVLVTEHLSLIVAEYPGQSQMKLTSILQDYNKSKLN